VVATSSVSNAADVGEERERQMQVVIVEDDLTSHRYFHSIRINALTFNVPLSGLGWIRDLENTHLHISPFTYSSILWTWSHLMEMIARHSLKDILFSGQRGRVTTGAFVSSLFLFCSSEKISKKEGKEWEPNVSLCNTNKDVVILAMTHSILTLVVQVPFFGKRVKRAVPHICSLRMTILNLLHWYLNMQHTILSRHVFL
jgi:hypothetical protein